MIRSDGVLDRQRRDRLRDAPCPGPTSARERQPLDCAIEELGRLFRPVGPPSFQLQPPCADAETHGLRLLARRSRQFGRARPGHRDDEVDAVEERPRELVAKGREPLRRALAVSRRIAARAAWTEVHRSDELETCWKHGSPTDARDADEPVLERLSQSLERGPLELCELVEDEHSAVRQADLPRLRARSAADQGRDRRVVVR